MKYLKTYEKIITKYDINKKYIILKQFSEYYLLKVLDFEYGISNSILCEKIYYYQD